ncbi:SMC-Scp complex subunit ScpB [Corynebacterium auriscanis]|uniref:Segregation and condensation protein B n=1 Tax=Corynebacterium auriscanis TaxID=99807 RepID=A0A0A2DGV9_9CORY|nr:SMC-Scp complex subunit ScpB [Corynebacterium auriscanis]KGM18403.1 segregation and condensation protein B [Corynebacterium auriscanis]WJY72625.1 Segregation and condensation protein B [Corynebacterium auriscanis]
MNDHENESAAAVPLAPVSLLRSRIESLLLVSDEPVTAAELARVLSTDATVVPANEIEMVLVEIRDEFDARGSGFELRESDGAYRLYTRRENSEAVEAKLLDGTQQRLSRAALETLAVVAYRQPVTRAQVSAVRGVNCDGVMRTLALRGLVSEVPEGPGGANLYSTTDLFLEQLGIASLTELPDLAPLLPEVDSIDD